MVLKSVRFSAALAAFTLLLGVFAGAVGAAEALDSSTDFDRGHVFVEGEVVATGTAQADAGRTVRAVRVTVQDTDSKQWLQPDGTFDAGSRRLGTDLSAEAQNVTWSIDLPLPPGNYGMHTIAVDDTGAQEPSENRRFVRFVVDENPDPTGGECISTMPAEEGTCPGSYLTLQFGRSQWGLSHRCELDPLSFTLGDTATFLAERGHFAQTTAAQGQMSSTDDGERHCPFSTQMTASWDDLAMLHHDFGWTVIGDSQAIYDEDGNMVEDRPRMPDLDPEEQHRQSCGSLEILEDRGFERAWGMYAYPGNKVDEEAQEDIVSNCYSFARRYGNPQPLEAIDEPWYVKTQSVNGGFCEDETLPCHTFHEDEKWNPNNRAYVTPDVLVQRAIEPGTWAVVQFYRLVDGTRLPEDAFPRDGHYWDCSAEDPRAHWTSQGEIYCANDFRAFVDGLSDDVVSVDAATVAELIGRGNPNPEEPEEPEEPEWPWWPFEES